MVYRIYVEKKQDFATQARHVYTELHDIVGILSLEAVRIINRYDVEGIDEALFNACIPTIFTEPQVDTAIKTLPLLNENEALIAIEYLPGQFDQRAESAAECIQLISQGERPKVATATLYILSGDISQDELERIKKHLVNPVEARLASLDEKDTLEITYHKPDEVEVIHGFISFNKEELSRFIVERGLAMDALDIAFCQEYFQQEQRDPTIAEIRMIDTYWSDHCRHTTFNTELDEITFDDDLVKKAFDRYLNLRETLQRTHKPISLMDMGTIGARALIHNGKLKNLDESEEINACTVKITCDVNGKDEDWLFLFKNETHNHPTEIEPFGGAATCVGGAIRDPLSGRSYVYQAMRVTGAGNPLTPIHETLPAKLPQRKIVLDAAQGYSSYGNQIGLATGLVDELYHPGYVAKRMEIGAVVGAAPAKNVKRERPVPGDKVILLGGKTGRDGIGGATGSSKAHTSESIETCGAEVQKGNAPVERKIQRLFKREDAATLIRRCNDFGAGGVSVAVGELADSLDINLDAVPTKYEGLDGTEIAIS
ncbi:MAG: phosphoribosylformylglycinamidine synthase, partial [Eggerthellaceae bacterium]|nr:phosphoribosylformylglycinamidine synthase [Eggerthellaceae bacterium]